MCAEKVMVSSLIYHTEP